MPLPKLMGNEFEQILDVRLSQSIHPSLPMITIDDSSPLGTELVQPKLNEVSQYFFRTIGNRGCLRLISDMFVYVSGRVSASSHLLSYLSKE